MIKYFRVLTPGQDPGTVVVVAEDSEAEALLRWVPNTGLWHRARELENDYLFGDEGGTYEPISADEAAKLIGEVTPFDERRTVAQRILARYRAQPPAEQRTNAEMGLSQAQTGMKPMSAPGLPELLRRSARSNRWRTLARYPPGAGSAPRQLVSDWSRRQQPLGLSGLEMRITEDQQTPLVQARAVRKKPIGTPQKAAAPATEKEAGYA